MILFKRHLAEILRFFQDLQMEWLDRKPELGGGRWGGRRGTRDGRRGGALVDVAERRGPEKEMDPELRGKLTLKSQARKSQWRIKKGLRVGWRVG